MSDVDMHSPPHSPATNPIASAAEEEARQQAQTLIQTGVMSRKNYNWLPFATALCLQGAVVPDETTNDDDYDADFGYGAHSAPPPHDHGRSNLTPPQAPHTGARDHVWYVPSWTHPRYNASYIEGYRTPRQLRQITDPAMRLRPAMLPQDALRNPTDYAKRFGIFPDDLGGRSHLSPTLAPSRNPMDDWVTKRDMLTDVEREYLTNETRNRGLGNPADPDHIDSTVLDEYYSIFGTNTGVNFRQQLAAALGNAELEQVVEQLQNTMPDTLTANMNFIDGALRDQNWQRFLFFDLSTDEMIKNNIHTMSNAETNHLTNDIHPWLSRDRWKPRHWQGTEDIFPTFMYTLNGERQEWNAFTNDDVWDAIQPALRFMTRVLNSKHPHYRDIMDMSTRQFAPEEQDPRNDENWLGPVTTERLTKFVRREKIDWRKSHEGIANLAVAGYDWVGNVERLMQERLIFEIGGGHFDSLEGKYSASVNYGYNYRYISKVGYEGIHDHDNIISIAAETIWPLLVPETSQSEKLVASFILAATMLHELSHAMVQSLQFLTLSDDCHPPEQSAETTQDLRNLGEDLWALELWDGDHTFEDSPEAEHGYQLEMEMFGWTMQTLMGTGIGLSRDLDMDTTVSRGLAWPNMNKERHYSLLEIGHWPPEDYCIPTPIDYMAKFFTEEFWTTDFAKYGHEALKQFSYEKIHKCTSYTFWNFTHLVQWFGTEDAAFIRTLKNQLNTNGHPILGHYIMDLYQQAMLVVTTREKWTRNIPSWAASLAIDPMIVDLRRKFRTSEGVHRLRASGDSKLFAYYGKYYLQMYAKSVNNGEAFGPPQSFAIWSASIEATWRTVYRDGGELMQDMTEIYNKMQRDIAVMQRLVLDFFNLQHDMRDEIYLGNPQCPSAIGIAFRRMEGLMDAAHEISQTALGISWLPELAHVQGQWEQWSARFRANGNMYNEMLDMLRLPADPFVFGRTIPKYDPNDMTWKAALKTIPSSYWKRRSDRLYLLASQQYNRVDQRIRDALDHASEVMKRVMGVASFQPPPDQDDLSNRLNAVDVQNTQRMQENRASVENRGHFNVPAAVARVQAGQAGAVAQATGNSPDDPMDVVLDGMIQAIDGMIHVAAANTTNSPAVPAAVPAASATQGGTPGPNAGIRFGQPSQFRSARTPRRSTAARTTRRRSASPPNSAMRPNARQTTTRADRSPTTPIPNPSPVGSSPGTNAGPRGYSAYAANNPGFAPPGSPQPPRPLGYGGAFQVSNVASAFPGNHSFNQTYAAFPHPYAGVNTSTQDVQHDAQERARLQAQAAANPNNPFRTNRLWRDTPSPGASPP